MEIWAADNLLATLFCFEIGPCEIPTEVLQKKISEKCYVCMFITTQERRHKGKSNSSLLKRWYAKGHVQADLLHYNSCAAFCSSVASTE